MKTESSKDCAHALQSRLPSGQHNTKAQPPPPPLSTSSPSQQHALTCSVCCWLRWHISHDSRLCSTCRSHDPLCCKILHLGALVPLHTSVLCKSPRKKSPQTTTSQVALICSYHFTAETKPEEVRNRSTQSRCAAHAQEETVLLCAAKHGCFIGRSVQKDAHLLTSRQDPA